MEAQPIANRASHNGDTNPKLMGFSHDGLTSEEARERLGKYGPNELPEHHTNAIIKFLSFLWGPIPWMIEVAAVLSLIIGHWVDLTIIMVLLVFNAAVGFWQEYQAGNAVAALKKNLALKSRVRRDNKWQLVGARDLVPGDLIRLRTGDIIPADATLVEGDYLTVDQSALTGESLPVSKMAEDEVYSGAIAKQGEMTAVVTATGTDTYFGHTAKLVADAGKASHFQRAVLRIGDYLIYLSLGLVVVLVLVQLFRGASLPELLQFALILTVASIPVAMPAVLSVTMAVGAMTLSKMKAIVSRLESIEEMAGMDILCSDKTGTLTRNELTLGSPQVYKDVAVSELMRAAALASKAENNDAIDTAIINALPVSDDIEKYEVLSFNPFDPVSKRTEASIRDGLGKTFKVTKGAPQVIMDLAGMINDERLGAEKVVNGFAAKGQRTIAVARDSGDGVWRYLGLLPLFDPPREDSADTIAQAQNHGIRVKMVTGDNLAIAREVSSQLGLGDHIQTADDWLDKQLSNPAQVADSEGFLSVVDGFAQVFPEHKYKIVKALQAEGHFVGMTGDGVNDAPALKQADIGIAVSGATDAARAAADLILTAPGLSVIVKAVEEARRIFERMNSYAIYRITETIRIMIFVVLASIVFNFYPITAVMIILLAFLNDIPIMTIAYDRTVLDPQPVRWNLQRIITAASFMGISGVIGSFIMLYIAMNLLHLSTAQVQTYIFLKMAVSGHLTLFVARSKHFFLKKPRPAPVMIWSAGITKLIATLLAVYGFGLMAPIRGWEAALIWGYAVVWTFLTDSVKLEVFRYFNLRAKHHRRFLTAVHDCTLPLGSHSNQH